MGIVVLVDPVAGTTTDATQQAANNAALKAVLNGGVDAANFAAGLVFNPNKIQQAAAAVGQALVWDGAKWAPGSGGSLATIFDVVVGRGNTGDPATGAVVIDSNTILGGNIPATYKHLHLRCSGRVLTAVSAANCTVNFNNDFTALYDYQYINGAHTSVSGLNALSAAGLPLFSIPGASATAGYLGGGSLDLFNYADTALFKMGLNYYFQQFAAAAGSDAVGQTGFQYRNVAALNRLALTVGGSGFAAGFRCTLYGMS